MAPLLSEGMKHRKAFRPKCVHEYHSNRAAGMEMRLEPFLMCCVSSEPPRLRGGDADGCSLPRARDCICLHFISIPVCLLPPLNFSDAGGDGKEWEKPLIDSSGGQSSTALLFRKPPAWWGVMGRRGERQKFTCQTSHRHHFHLV